jgi:hypothetical protein
MKYVLLVLFTGCAAQSLDAVDIACTSDSECPDDAWCDQRFTDNANTCLSLATTAPPLIVFDGFEQGDNVVPTLTVPPHTFTFGTLALRNTGSESYVLVTVTGPPCVDAASETRSDGELVEQDKVLAADFGVDPAAGCASPATLAITATASKRVFSFTAVISIAP